MVLVEKYLEMEEKGLKRGRRLNYEYIYMQNEAQDLVCHILCVTSVTYCESRLSFECHKGLLEHVLEGE